MQLDFGSALTVGFEPLHRVSHADFVLSSNHSTIIKRFEPACSRALPRILVYRSTMSSDSTYLSITTKMTCGGCSGTVEKALLDVNGVTGVSVSLTSQTALVTTQGCAGCTCKASNGGTCPCGDACECTSKALIAAAAAVGFDAVKADAAAHSCSSAKKGGPCNSPSCTCGPNCQCGDDCKCASCPQPFAISSDMLTHAAIGIAIFAAGWMAAKRFS